MAMYCEYCGASVIPSSIFCAQCGQDIGGASASLRMRSSRASNAKRRASPPKLLTVSIFSIPVFLVTVAVLWVINQDDLSEARKFIKEANDAAADIADNSAKES